MRCLGEDFFLLEKLYHNSGIPVAVYREGEKIVGVPESKPEFDIFYNDRELLSNVFQAIRRKKIPVIYIDDMTCLFGAFADKEGQFYIWGPVSLEKQDEMKMIAFRQKHHISEKKYTVRESSQKILANILSIAFYFYCDEKVDETDIFLDWYGEDEKYSANAGIMEKYHLEKSETGWMHDSIEHEREFVQAIEEGDISAIKRLLQMNTNDIGGIGIVADNSFKQMEYMCVSGIILASRAAIKGGLNPEEAYDLSDVYLQRLAKSKTMEELGLVCVKANIDYTERVKAAKIHKRGNVYVEQCKDYIAKHLRNNFQISEIADILEINRSYLSRIFSEQEGMSIQQYITKERCSHAANMLKYTEYSISLVAEYFCFASQSHFGKQFKNIYGITPNEYRKQNRYIDSFFQ